MEMRVVEVNSMKNEEKEKFEKLAEAQRGRPEQAMLKIQRSQISQLYGYLAEHIGDLTHRMSEKIGTLKGGYENVKKKVELSLRALKQSYGFEKEVKEQIKSNLRHDKEIGKEDDNTTYEDRLEKLKELGEQYAKEHKKLPTFNNAQKIAQKAAIAYGNFDFKNCIDNLERLKSILDKGEENWQEFATKTND